MKTKFFFFVAVVAMCVACNGNNPESKELIGTWSEPYHVDIMVKTMTFNDDGTLTYTNRPDTTWDVVIDYAGEFAQLRYTAKNHQLHISGERKYYDNTIGKMAYEPFTFSTGYSIKENVLTLDSFSYDGGYSKYYKPVILYRTEYPSKKEKIPSAQLDEEQINQLNVIFKRENTLLKDFPSCNVIVIHSPEELRCICPINDSIPNLDFSKQCLVFAPIDLSSVNDEIVGCNLYRNTENDIFEYEVEIQKCTECYHVTDHVYAYGIYSIPSEEIKQIDTYVQLLYRY